MNNDTTQNQRDPIGANAEPVARTLQLLRAGSFHFGVFVDEIATIVAWREPAPLPHAPKSVLGVVSIQGRMLTVLDLATLHGDETFSSETRGQHIVALRGDEQLALAADAVGETVDFAATDFAANETAGTPVLGVLHRAGAEINILNLKELFPAAIQGRERRRRRF